MKHSRVGVFSPHFSDLHLLQDGFALPEDEDEDEEQGDHWEIYEPELCPSAGSL